MSRSLNMVLVAVCAVSAVLATSVAGTCATIFIDGFEPQINGNLWVIGPWEGLQGKHVLEGDNNHLRTPGMNSAFDIQNYRYTYNSQHAFPIPYANNVYLKCWVFEDNNSPWPYPLVFPHTDEEWPNLQIALLDTTSPGAEVFMIGVMGEIGRTYGKIRAFFDHCCVYTTTDTYQVLDGQYDRQHVPRRQGWRKYTILVNGYTGNAGDVQFLIDDRLVYSGHRASPPWGGGAPIDTIVLGSKWWTFEHYWFDHVSFGTIDTPVVCSLISEANALPDDTWVSLTGKVVMGCFTKSPFPGYLAIEEDNRSGSLWVSTSYVANVWPATNDAERVNVVKGIMRTNEAGMRYLDAIQMSQAATSADQPRVLGTILRSLGSPALDGKLVKVWGKVVYVPGSNPPTVRGQERKGDWRRYFLIDDGSPGGPVKCYYDNIISGIDPVPEVNYGDYVSVVGVAGREVMVPGTTGPERGVWIRGAGDLRILRAPS